MTGDAVARTRAELVEAEERVAHLRELLADGRVRHDAVACAELIAAGVRRRLERLLAADTGGGS